MADRLTDPEIQLALEHLRGDWRREGNAFVVEFQFDDFAAALAQLNAIAQLAEEAGHHPDLHLHDWNKLLVRLSTHSAGGITASDVSLATAIAATVTRRVP